MATTTDGKAVSARNATTHGLFCRQTVLPHLGEDPAGYEKMLLGLMEGLDPRTLMERQYLELWAEASWKLRRLARWEAQMWEADSLDEDALLAKLERVNRLQTTLRRQLDKAVRMLGGQDVPSLYAQRARRHILVNRGYTEVDCRGDRHIAGEVEMEVLLDLEYGDRLHGLDKTQLDTGEHKKCQNKLAPEAPITEKCQNELPSDPADAENRQNELEGEAPTPDTDAPDRRSRYQKILEHTRRTGDNPFYRGQIIPPSPHALKM